MLSVSLDNLEGERIMVGDIVACSHCCDDGEDDVGCHDERDDRVEQDSDEQRREPDCDEQGDDSIDGHGDLEVHGLPALLVHDGIFILLEEPDNERAQDISEGYAQQDDQCREMAEHSPYTCLVFLHRLHRRLLVSYCVSIVINSITMPEHQAGDEILLFFIHPSPFVSSQD